MSITRFTALGLAAVALVVAGCTKAADSPTVSPSDSDSAATSSASQTPSATETSASTAPPATTSASTSASTTSSMPSPPKTSTPIAAGCPAASLSVAVNRGSGVAGHQYATVVFTNTSKTACPLTGFPSVQLLAAGAPVGSSVRSTAAAATVRLAPGATASSQLVNDSTCGAAESDSVQITPPNTSAATVAALVFRGCTVTVGPVTPS